MGILKALSLLFFIASVLGVEQTTVDVEGEPPVDFEHENILGILAFIFDCMDILSLLLFILYFHCIP